MKFEHKIFDSISCIDSEDLVYKAYDGLLSTLNLVKNDERNRIAISSINGNRGRDPGLFEPLVTGIYIPGSKRSYWAGYVDPSDGEPIETGSVYVTPRYTDVSFEYITVKRIKKLPSSVTCSCKNIKYLYKTYNTLFIKGLKENAHVEESYYAIDDKGNLYSTFDKLKFREASNFGRLLDVFNRDRENAKNYTTGALSLLADRKYLWNVKTTETVDGKYDAIVNFGVEEEAVKSLVFARDEPLTKKGRKRPILHWVKMHKRRIERGVKIDVRKHLRGVETFTIDNLKFEITEPRKQQK